MTHGLPALSTLTAVDGYFRLLANIRSRIRTIRFHQDVLGNSPASARHLSALQTLLAKSEKLPYGPPSKNGLRHLSQAFRHYGSTEAHMRAIYGRYLKPTKGTPDLLMDRYLDNLRIHNASIRTHELQTRIHLEILHRQAQAWFIIFNTLTVSDAHYDRVFSPDSRAFETYIAAFKRKINYAIRGKATPPAGLTTHSYFAVIEKGSSTGRLHFHVLHFCMALPDGSIDPNIGLSTPNRRIIDAIRPTWPYGFSSPIAVRFSSADRYGLAGWRWPVTNDGPNTLSLKPSTEAQLAAYISKYITKAKKEHFPWKTRMSQKFGKTIIQEAISLMSTPTLEQHLATINSHRQATILGITLPRQTLQQEATREILRRLKMSSNELDSERSMKLKSLIMLTPRSSIVEQLRTLTQPTRNHSSPNSGTFATANSNATAIFEARELFEATLTKYGHNPSNIPGGGTTRET